MQSTVNLVELLTDIVLLVAVVVLFLFG